MHHYIKAWNFKWKVYMTLEVQIHSDPPTDLSSWVFYWPEWVLIGNNCFSSKVLILYTAGKLIKNWTQNNKRVGSGNRLLTSYSRTEILKNPGKVTILVPVCSCKCSCNKVTVFIKNCWRFKSSAFETKLS